jgi:O-antigen/teichoic acid export membrane protein
MPLVFGRPFAAAAPALAWIAIALVPSVTNSTRKVFLYASGGEAIVVRWTAAALALQAAAAAVLIPPLGAVGAALAVAISEAAIWVPLRRADPSAVGLKPDAAYVS